MKDEMGFRRGAEKGPVGYCSKKCTNEGTDAATSRHGEMTLQI